MLRFCSLFAGIGGLELGLEWSGVGRTVLQVERDAYCRSVLARHWPGVPRVGNIKLFGKDRWGSRAVEWPEFDLVCGGFPCQDVSGAGKGAGLAGSRSGLWREFARVVSEFLPRWVVVENVASGANRWVDAVVRDLGQLGYEALPLPIAAEDVGAPHRRARVFVVARRVPDAVGGQVREREQRGPARRPRGGTRRLGANRWTRGRRSGGGAASALAHHHHHGLQAVGRGGLPDGPPALGYDAHGRCGAWPWPPGPGDLDGWAGYLAAGGPEPALLRGAHGLRCGLAKSEWERQLKALGNSVVPQCSEVVGYVIREIEGE